MNKFEESDKFNEYQMEQIRYELKKGLGIDIYVTNSELSSYLMEIIRIGLENGLNINAGVCEWKQTSTAKYKTSCGYKIEEYFDTNACYCKQCGKKIKILKN